MNEFKNQQECWQALMNGKTLASSMGFICRMRNGSVVYENGNPSSKSFIDFEYWRTYSEPKKLIKIAPALLREGQGNYGVGYPYFKSQADAEYYYGKSFIKWLIDTHAVEVEE